MDGASDGAPQIDGKPGAHSISLAGSVRLVQGGAAKIGVVIKRGGVAGKIVVTATKLPAGVLVKDLVLDPDSTGDLEFDATTAAIQGSVSGALVRAIASDGTTATAPLDLFVRGVPGAIDTTYGVAGLSDLGPATSVTTAQTSKYVLVGTATLQRFLRDGTPDNAFAQPSSASTFSVFDFAKDDSVFASNGGIVHYLSTGALDPAFPATSIPASTIPSVRAIAVNGSSETVVFGQTLNQTEVRALKLTATGATAPDFTFTPWAHPGASETSAGPIVAQADGTFVAASGGTGLGAVTVLRLTASGAVDSTFAGGAGYADATVGTTSAIIFAYALRVTPAGIFCLGAATNGDKFGLARFTSDGTLDTAFGGASTPGVASTPPRPLLQSSTVGFDVDGLGRPIIASVTMVAGAQTLALSRFTAAGKADATFAPTGLVTLPFGSVVSPKGVVAVDNERILVIGLRDGNAFIARLWM